MRVQLGKEWAAVNWDRGVLDKDGDLELLPSHEFILPEKVASPPPPPVVLASPPLPEGTNPALSVESVVTFHDAVPKGDSAVTPQDPPPQPPALARPLEVRCTVWPRGGVLLSKGTS